MWRQEIQSQLQQVVHSLGFYSSDIVLSISENSRFGDYTTNILLQLAKQKAKKSYQSSLEIANEVIEKFNHPFYLERIEIAGPGFLNFFLKDSSLIGILAVEPEPKKSDKKTLVEYASPNANKPFHIGHLRNITIGESVARIIQNLGEEVFRVTYTSDIGPATAKAVWGVKQLGDKYQKAKEGSLKDKVVFLGEAYVYGNKAFEEDPKAKEEISQINILIYQQDQDISKIWLEARDWSQAYLNTIYSRVGSEFDAEIWESQVGEIGKEIVKQNLGRIFIEDQGAVIFPGEKYGLHNRVFINSEGNPTYEAKELGVTVREEELFPFDRAIHVVANEQSGYFQVVIKAVELTEKRLLGKKKHLSHGMVNLSTGKMSSRKGNVISVDDLIDQVKDKVKQEYSNPGSPQDDYHTEKVAIGAIKFFMLKYGLSTDINFDVAESISLQGDTGPYVMYAYARTQSILKNAGAVDLSFDAQKYILEEEERQLLRFIEYFETIVDKAAVELAPNHIANFLLQLAKTFSLFYEKYPIIRSKNESFRVSLTKKVGETIKKGLYLLGIEAIDRM